MIRTVTKDNADHHVSHLHQMHLYQMHRIRKTAFNDRLGWDVTVERIARRAGWDSSGSAPRVESATPSRWPDNSTCPSKSSDSLKHAWAPRTPPQPDRKRRTELIPLAEIGARDVSNPFDDRGGIFIVLINDQDQHSLWPTAAEIPAGWSIAFEQNGRHASNTSAGIGRTCVRQPAPRSSGHIAPSITRSVSVCRWSLPGIAGKNRK
jgi:uncharacterized protein YbdZ (MbtH family)